MFFSFFFIFPFIVFRFGIARHDWLALLLAIIYVNTILCVVTSPLLPLGGVSLSRAARKDEKKGHTKKNEQNTKCCFQKSTHYADGCDDGVYNDAKYGVSR